MTPIQHLLDQLIKNGRELSQNVASELDTAISEWEADLKLPSSDNEIGIALTHTNLDPVMVIHVRMDFSTDPDRYSEICALLDQEDDVFGDYEPLGDAAVEYANAPPDLNGRLVKALEMSVSGFAKKIGFDNKQRNGVVTWKGHLGLSDVSRVKPRINMEMVFEFDVVPPNSLLTHRDRHGND